MPGTVNFPDHLQIEPLLNLTREAGHLIMEVYRTPFDVEYKDDKSPLTLADTQSNACIRAGLEKLYPDIPILSEETQTVPYDERKNWEWFWLVDPLDGTREFVKKNDEFTINIALIQNSVPVFGIIYAPALNKIVYGTKGKGAYTVNNGSVIPLPAHYPADEKVLTVAGSRSHGGEGFKKFVDTLMPDYKNIEVVSAGSALKFCLLAEGKANIYPRLGPTMEWDTAAGQAIVTECGKQVLEFDSDKPLTYNKPDLLNPYFICR